MNRVSYLSSLSEAFRTGLFPAPQHCSSIRVVGMKLSRFEIFSPVQLMYPSLQTSYPGRRAFEKLVYQESAGLLEAIQTAKSQGLRSRDLVLLIPMGRLLAKRSSSCRLLPNQPNLLYSSYQPSFPIDAWPHKKNGLCLRLIWSKMCWLCRFCLLNAITQWPPLRAIVPRLP